MSIFCTVTLGDFEIAGRSTRLYRVVRYALSLRDVFTDHTLYMIAHDIRAHTKMEERDVSEIRVRSFTKAADVDAAVRAEGRIAYAEVPAPEYHATQAVSQSTLKKLSESPSKLRWELNNPSRTSSSALTIGSAVHCALLEPDKFEDQFIAMPKVDRRTKEGKARYEEFERIAKGRTILSQDEMDAVVRIHQRASDDDRLGVFFKGGHREMSFFVRDELTGLVLRCRPDQIVDTPHGQFIVDLKTTDCAKKEVFERDILKYGYLTQAAFYMDTVEAATGRRPDGFVIVAVEKSRDCDYTTWVMPDDVLAYARTEYRALLDTFAGCVTNDVWPGYAREMIEFKLPHWKRQQIEAGEEW